MRNYPAIRNFLSLHPGYYCAECLAVSLNLTSEAIRHSVGQRKFSEVTVGYRICQSCLAEKGVFALRHCA